MRLALIVLAGTILLSQSCTQTKSAASEFLEKKNKASGDSSPAATDKASGEGDGSAPAGTTSKTAHSVQESMCQQFEFPAAIELDPSMEEGLCPSSIDVEGTATAKAKSCPSVELDGSKVTFVMYGSGSDAAATDEVCAAMNKSILESAKGAELK
jgi:hypothetical protein